MGQKRVTDLYHWSQQSNDLRCVFVTHYQGVVHKGDFADWTLLLPVWDTLAKEMVETLAYRKF